jgi:2-amino-4-hydroxy-6-hydroxymethyldihydropteridine diphosphokinase
MQKTERCYIGLGANLVEPLAQLQTAIAAMRALPDTELLQVSRFYNSKPMGPQDQPDYINAVALLETGLAPLQLLRALQQIELDHGRQRTGERWGPRTLDLDILLFGEEQIHHPELTVPHYAMHLREFVLYPLAELAPDLILPNGVSLNSLLQQVPLNGLTPL